MHRQSRRRSLRGQRWLSSPHGHCALGHGPPSGTRSPVD